MEGAVTSLLIRNSAAFQRNDISVLLDYRTTYEFNDRHIDRTSVVGLGGRNGVSDRETRHERSLLRARGHVWGLVEPIALFLMDA